jgi:small subunit ribosomal protein S3
MIERKIITQKMKEFQIQEYISSNLRNSGHSHTQLQRTPLGEKIIIYASRPGIIVGRKGANIKKLTTTMKKSFNIENPQIEIAEVENVNLDAQVVAERIAQSLERFGSARFKGIVHKVMQDIMDAGALGAEVVISGKVPSTRAKSWRFYNGYLKKCGDIALTGVHKAYANAKLKSGVVGVKVRIMPPTTTLPDAIEVLEEARVEEEQEEKAKPKKKKTRRKSPKAKKEKEAKAESPKEEKTEANIEEKKQEEAKA